MRKPLRTSLLCMACVVASVLTTTSGAALDEFKKTAKHRIVGHDDGGAFVVAHAHKEAEECAQLCLDDRGCVSFEVGVDGDARGDCTLSYDTARSVVRGMWAAVKDWDFYELGRAHPAPLQSFKKTEDRLLTGQDTAGLFLNVTQQACAQRCLHTPQCKSFDYGNRCRDSPVTGIVNAQTRKPLPCSVLGAFCIAATQGYGLSTAVQKACPKTCADTFNACYSSTPGPACQDVKRFVYRCADNAASGACAGNTSTTALVRKICPASCRKALAKAATGRQPDFERDLCQSERNIVGECMLSFFANGDAFNNKQGAGRVSLSTMDGWAYFERQSSRGEKCKGGTASATGFADDALSAPCTICPNNTYTNRQQTRCDPCPPGYTSATGSTSVFACKRGMLGSQEPSKFFQVGEQWVGSYWWHGDGSKKQVDQGHGRLELYVVAAHDDGSVAVLRKFQNSFTSGSYYMTAKAAPKLHDKLTLAPGEWADQPPDRKLKDGSRLVTKRTELVGNVSKSSDDKVVFHGDMCGNGHFSVTRACSVALNPTFAKGEHWIGSYSCEDTRDPDRFDIRRLDVVVDAVKGSRVKVHSKFEHQDGQGSFKLAGDYDKGTGRLHLTADGRDAWIRKPVSKKGRWYTSDLNGHVTGDHLVYTGSKNMDPNCACRDACDLESVNGTNMFHYRCTTHDTCPNAERANSGAYRVSCGSSTQVCTKFVVNRVCTPHDKSSHNDDPCFCTGQIDTRGRGGTCAEPSGSESDEAIAGRGFWCHVDSECIVSGPADDGAISPSKGGVATSGLWWASCNPNATRPTAAPSSMTTATSTTNTTTTTTNTTTSTTTNTTTQTTTTNTTATATTTTRTTITPLSSDTAQPTKPGSVLVQRLAKLLSDVDAAKGQRNAVSERYQSQCGSTSAPATRPGTGGAGLSGAGEGAEGKGCNELLKAFQDAEKDLAMATLQYKTYADVGETWAMSLVLEVDFDECCLDPANAAAAEATIASAIALRASVTTPIVMIFRGSVVVDVVVKSPEEQSRVSRLASACELCFELWGQSFCPHVKGGASCAVATAGPLLTPGNALTRPIVSADAAMGGQSSGGANTTAGPPGPHSKDKALGAALLGLIIAAVQLLWIIPCLVIMWRRNRKGDLLHSSLQSHMGFANPLYAGQDDFGNASKENPIYHELASDGLVAARPTVRDKGRPSQWNEAYQATAGEALYDDLPGAGAQPLSRKGTVWTKGSGGGTGGGHADAEGLYDDLPVHTSTSGVPSDGDLAEGVYDTIPNLFEGAGGHFYPQGQASMLSFDENV